jgi:coenzyme F420-0:L-glutamate ligase/coenzyme F420-1:gamma-L-glutamate ligase
MSTNGVPQGFSAFGIPGLPMVAAGDDLPGLVLDALAASGLELEEGDCVCLAQKIVSKAEGRQIPLAGITPSPEAERLAAETDKDPRLVQLILDESTEVLRQKPGVLIMRHKLGLVGAHAGIDQSNIDHEGGEQALLLPVDPDASAARFRAEIKARTGKAVGVIITDSANRPWRLGTIGIAIGAAGLSVLDDHRGGRDAFGRELKVTLINRADAIASMATMIMGETTERMPAAIIRGLPLVVGNNGEQTAATIIRPLEEDLFR